MDFLGNDYSLLLEQQEAIEIEASKSSKEKFLEKNFDYNDYPKFEDWRIWMLENFDKKTQNIPTSSLNVRGKVVRDSFDDYLTETKFSINEDGTFKGYLQSSHLKAASLSPRHLFFKIHDNIVPKPDIGKHFDLGEALHACILEPTRFGRFVTAPKVNGASHDGTDKLIAFWEEQSEHLFISECNDIQEGLTKAKNLKKLLIAEGNYLPKALISEIYDQVCITLERCKNSIKENYNFDEIKKTLISHYERMQRAGFEATWLDKIIKNLSLQKTVALAVRGKKDAVFNAAPLIEQFQLYCDSAAISKHELKEKGDIIFRSLEEKKAYIEAIKKAIQLEEVDEYQMAMIKAIKLAYETYGGGIIPRLVKHTKRENSIYCDDYRGLPLKVRPDAMAFEENIGVNAIISVKSTSAQNIGKFFYDTAKFNYETSEGMYQEIATEVTGREFKVTFTIMFQTVEPYGVALFWWMPDDLALGTTKFKDSVEITRQALEENKFPGYDMYAEEGHFGVIPMKLPYWSYKSLEPGDLDN